MPHTQEILLDLILEEHPEHFCWLCLSLKVVTGVRAVHELVEKNKVTPCGYRTD